MRDPAQGDTVEPGAVLGGRYRILGLLGTGGMAEVFRVLDQASGRELALKVLRSEVASQPEAVERFRREAAVLASIAHPAIVAIETSGTLEDGRVFLAMEVLHGRTLRARMREGPMRPSELAPLVATVASGLAAAHQRGIVHRDLKPDNIFLLDPPGPAGPAVKILDFGVSKVLGQGKLTHTGQIIGTPRYMAPEQLTAERDLDARVDVYALGVILYEALAGQPPFLPNDPAELIVAVLQGRHTPLPSLRVDLPPGVAAVVARAMHRDRASRYATVEELARSFLQLARQEPGPARPGVCTDALGSMEAPADASRASRASSEVAPVRPSTYSAVEAMPSLFPPRRADPSPAPNVPAEAMHRAPAEAPPPRVPSAAREVREPMWTPEGSDPQLSSIPGLRRWPWVLAGLTAGMAAALVLLWATGGFGLFAARGAAPESPAILPPTTARAAPAPDAPTAAVLARDLSATPPPSPAASDAGSAEAAASPEGQASPRPAPAHRRRPPRPHRSRRRAPPAAAHPTAPEASAVAPSARQLLHDARAALASKDYARCQERIDAALSAGAPASALRLRGDCLLAAGDRTGAITAYRRFCRLVPDHPAIGEVRALLASMGASCP